MPDTPAEPDIPTEEESILEKGAKRSNYGDWFPGEIAQKNRMFEDLREDANVDSRGFLVTLVDQLLLWVVLPIVVCALLVLFFVIVHPELPR